MSLKSWQLRKYILGGTKYFIIKVECNKMNIWLKTNSIEYNFMIVSYNLQQNDIQTEYKRRISPSHPYLNIGIP